VLHKSVIVAIERLIQKQVVRELSKNKLKTGKTLQTYKNVRSVMG
jgi:hypothetical protein